MIKFLHWCSDTTLWLLQRVHYFYHPLCNFCPSLTIFSVRHWMPDWFKVFVHDMYVLWLCCENILNPSAYSIPAYCFCQVRYFPDGGDKWNHIATSKESFITLIINQFTSVTPIKSDFQFSISIYVKGYLFGSLDNCSLAPSTWFSNKWTSPRKPTFLVWVNFFSN